MVYEHEKSEKYSNLKHCLTQFFLFNPRNINLRKRIGSFFTPNNIHVQETQSDFAAEETLQKVNSQK